MHEIVLATHNPGKLNEYRTLVADLPLTWRLLSDLNISADVEETGETFEANARLKAETYAQMSDLPTLADDSGLVVDALDGAPGVYSARYAGPGATDTDRYTLLLANLADVPDPQRSARFVCVVALALPGGVVHTARGAVEGYVLHVPRGTNGFGYDPVFFVTETGCSMAELAAEQKNLVSHRGRALMALRPQLKRLAGD